MEKIVINYICEWGWEKSTAWSGTLYFLLQALNKDSRVEINDIDITPNNFLEKIIKKIYWVFPRLYYVLFKMFVVPKVSKKIKGNIILSPGSYIFGSDYDHYTYQDLSYLLLEDLKRNKHLNYNYSGFKFSLRKMKYLANREAKFYKQAKGIFTMSEYLKDYLKKCEYDFDKTKVIHVGSGANSISKLDKVEKENSFLFIGKDFIRKSGDIVCKAFESIQGKLPKHTKLYIIGPDNIDVCYLTKNIVFLGKQSYDVCAEYMKKCKVFVMPSRFEPYGLVFAEALISGCICIGNNDYEMKYFINNDNGYLVNINNNDEDVEKLADVMLSSITDEKIIDSNLYKSKFNWDNVASIMVDSIEKGYK